MKKHRFFWLSLLLVLTSFSASAKRVDPYTSSRIFWDLSSRKQLFSGALYARMIELQDGRLLAVAASGKVMQSISTNKGISWSEPEVLFSPPANYHYYDADLFQTSDGTIIICYNIGPNTPYDDTRHYGVRINRSYDNGQTWTADQQIFTAGTNFNVGCWEPAILELPSGELHLYVSDETPFSSCNDQCIQLLRSYDKGVTWSSTPETISYRPNARDGMPTPVLIGDSIIVTIEDSKWPGAVTFVPVTLRSSVEDNWKGITVGPTSPYRSQVIDYNWCPVVYGGGPYMRILPWGETVLSRQAYHESGTYDVMNMYVYVGDENARGFKGMSQPFPDNSESGISIEWNSISVIDTGVVCALGGVGAGSSSHRVDIVKGYPMRMFKAYRGTPDVNGVVGSYEYHTKAATQVMMGSNTIGRSVFADFNYDDDNLYFVIRVSDNTPFTTTSQTDAVRLLLDVDDVSDDTPVEGMFNFYFNTTGAYKCWQGNNGSWKVYADTTGVDYCLNRKSSYYIMEAAIPWSVLGKTTTPVGQRMAMGIEVFDRASDHYYTETMPDVKKEQSWTWMEFRLEDSPSAIAEVEKDDVGISVRGNEIEFSDVSEIKKVDVFSVNGQKVLSTSDAFGSLFMPSGSKGIYVVRVKLNNGHVVTRKVVLRE